MPLSPLPPLYDISLPSLPDPPTYKYVYKYAYVAWKNPESHLHNLVRAVDWEELGYAGTKRINLDNLSHPDDRVYQSEYLGPIKGSSGFNEGLSRAGFARVGFSRVPMLGMSIII